MEDSTYDVVVIDGICGSGKTTTAIQLIKDLTLPFTGYGSRRQDKFIFVTPFIMEAHRIAGSVPIDIPKEHAEAYEGYEISEYSEFDEGINKNQRTGEDGAIIYRDNAPTDRKFILPKSTGEGIIEEVKEAIWNGLDIVITHATFSNFDQELLDAIRYNDVDRYQLIIDEVPSLFEQLKFRDLKLTQDDINTLYRSGNLIKDEDDFVSWVATDKIEKLDVYSELIKLCDQKRVVQYADTGDTKILMKRHLPECFKLFKSVYILTYLFEGSISKSYFDLYGISYKIKQQRSSVSNSVKYWELIQFPVHLNNTIHNFNEYSLTKTWYLRNSRNFNKLMSATSNFFNNDRKVKLNERLWTVFKDYKGKVGGNGYKSRFLSLNSRATNVHINVKSMAYLVNLFPYSPVSTYFAGKGHPVDSDKYALAELIQWIFRSQIRAGKPIKLFLPSPRMRRLLEAWMDGLKKEFEEANP